MNISKLILSVSITLIYLQAFSQHSISVINSTNFYFDTQVEQTGSDTLPPSEWWGWAGEYVHWQPDTVMLAVRDSLVQIGDTIEFSVWLNNAGDTVQIQQRIIKTGAANEVSYKVSGNSFSHPWIADTNFHEELILIDTTQVIIKYKIDTSADLSLAIHTKHIYAIDEADFNAPNVLNVMAYNVMLIWFVSENFEERAVSVARYISPYQDVVIFEEAFEDSSRINFLTPTMEAAGFIYSTTILNDPALPHISQPGNGGVIIYSKWPIEATAEYVYKACKPGSNDCLAAKGVKYALINKMGKRYHVFGTHMQAGNNSPEKKMQFAEARDFIDSMSISPLEPVIFGGDMNVAPNSGDNNYQAIRDSIQPIIPHSIGYHSSSFKKSNDKIGRIIDHVWASRFHLAPAESFNAIISIRGINDEMWNIFDWSGHRTATGRFEYPGPLQANFTGTLCAEDTLILKVNPMPNVTYQWFKDGQAINVINNEMRFENPSANDNGHYICEATYTVIYGNTNDTLIQALYPDGPDTIESIVLFDMATIAFHEICVSGVPSNNEGTTLNVYPTISDGLFYLEGNIKVNTELRVYNAAGHLVKKQLVSNAITAINLTEFGSGLYLISYQERGKVYSRKVIIR